jgi:hypothetical protein
MDGAVFFSFDVFDVDLLKIDGVALRTELFRQEQKMCWFIARRAGVPNLLVLAH